MVLCLVAWGGRGDSCWEEQPRKLMNAFHVWLGKQRNELKGLYGSDGCTEVPLPSPPTMFLPGKSFQWACAYLQVGNNYKLLIHN